MCLYIICGAYLKYKYNNKYSKYTCAQKDASRKESYKPLLRHMYNPTDFLTLP